MKKSRLALNSAAIFGAGLCWAPGAWGQATVSYPTPLDGAVIYTADPTPNRPNGSGGQYGNPWDLISSVVITTGYENIQSASTTVPANTVTAPAIFIQINVNPGTVANPSNITLSTQWYADYDFAMETSPGAGLVTAPASVTNPYGNPFGISTGENYYINGFNDKGTSPSTTGGNQVYQYQAGYTGDSETPNWAQVAGVSPLPAGSPYNATTTNITATSITFGIPLADLGLHVGSSFTFDAYDDYPSSAAVPYDALDNSAFAPPGYQPYTGGGITQAAYYDSATEPGSALSTFTVSAPTLTWNNTSAAAGFGDGVTWDNNTTNTPTNYNWNNGIYADYYVDGSNVIFNDNNNATSNGGTNPNAYNVTLNTLVAPASVLVNNSLGNYTISGTGTIGGAGSLTKSGTDTLTLSTANTYSGGTTVTAGKLLIEPTSPTSSALPHGALSISGSGIVQLADNVTAGTPLGTSNVSLTSLSITGNGTLDIGNNRIIIDYSSPATDPIASIASWIKNGFYDLAGPQIISSDIAADDAASGLSYGIGYADGADGVVAGLPSGEIEVMLTLLGDANLDGTVNTEDFTQFSTNLGQSGKSWDDGDFNYDGTVNTEDFTLFSHNLGESDSLAAAAGTLQAADGLSLANVPEPASCGLLLVGVASLLSRRSRRRCGVGLKE
jgi:autotransporter-associated beta strand protein